MKEEKYKIKTIEDILKVVTPKNMECFLKDFGSWLALSVMAKEANKAMGDILNVKTSGVFTWIDDGKNDINIRIEVTNKSSK